MATDLIGSAGKLTGIGQGGGGGGSFGLVLFIFGLIIFFGIIAAAVTFWIVYKRQYKINVKKWERVDGRYKPVSTIKAKVIPIGNGGDSALQLKKPKKMLPMPTIQTGDNTYWYFVSDDGEWINFGPGDFDEDRKKMGAHMLDKEMRYARTSLQHMGKERYDDQGFWERHGGKILVIIEIIIFSIGIFLIVKEMASTANAAAQAAEVSKEVMKEAARVLGALDNLKGGSGISPA